MSQLSDTGRLILDIFGELNFKKNQGFKLMDLILNKAILNTPHQETFSMAVYQLIDMGYLEWSEESTLILTEKGYKALNN